MGESKEIIDLKKKRLIDELSKPEEEQNKLKIRRLKDNIERNKKWAYIRKRLNSRKKRK